MHSEGEPRPAGTKDGNERHVKINVPGPNAGWPEIAEFALSFGGYDYCGSFERCAELAHFVRRQYFETGKIDEETPLEELRSCLFFQQRAFRHCYQLGDFGLGFERDEPDEHTMEYVRALVEAIRRKVCATGARNEGTRSSGQA